LRKWNFKIGGKYKRNTTCSVIELSYHLKMGKIEQTSTKKTPERREKDLTWKKKKKKKRQMKLRGAG